MYVYVGNEILFVISRVRYKNSCFSSPLFIYVENKIVWIKIGIDILNERIG